MQCIEKVALTATLPWMSPESKTELLAAVTNASATCETPSRWTAASVFSCVVAFMEVLPWASLSICTTAIAPETVAAHMEGFSPGALEHTYVSKAM